ncbi:MAG: hypothetical protein Q8L98_04780 [Chlamydiales bacterium]|nr:hypothetical protein [Chlamydiales bacterium]
MKLKSALIVGGILAIAIWLFLIRPTNRQHVHMNNQTCPVSGRPVNGTDTYVHKGKKYNLCSDRCKKPLSEDPEKYLSD